MLLQLCEGVLLVIQVRALCNGVIETMGRVRYEGKVKHPMTAHPKIDPDTGGLQVCHVSLHEEQASCVVHTVLLTHVECNSLLGKHTCT